MPTIASARMRIIEELARAGVDAPVLTADLLTGYVLGWDRVRVLAHPEAVLDAPVWSRLQDLVSRRLRREPLQYLTGEREFYGRSFRVTPDVLIPRQETEFLVEAAVEWIRGRGRFPVRFADIGAGSGCIALSVACETADSFGYAVDVSPGALRVAGDNARRLGVDDRVQRLCADLLECFPLRPCLDLIMSNPPYIPIGEYNSLPREVRDYEPHQALFGGESGLDVYHRLIPASAARLHAGGCLMLECGAGQMDRIRLLMEASGLELKTVINDLQGIPRCLVARKPGRSVNG